MGLANSLHAFVTTTEQAYKETFDFWYIDARFGNRSFEFFIINGCAFHNLYCSGPIKPPNHNNCNVGQKRTASGQSINTSAVRGEDIYCRHFAEQVGVPLHADFQTTFCCKNLRIFENYPVSARTKRRSIQAVQYRHFANKGGGGYF